MAINKTITIGYGGKEYQIKVTMGVIDRLEEQMNLIRFAERLANRDVRFAHAAKLIAVLLQEAGATVSQDEVYQAMFGGGEVSQADVIQVCGEVLQAIFPPPIKKPEAQVAAGSKRSRGRTSTK